MSTQQKIRTKQRKGNILKHIIPGLRNEIEIPFPDRKLPVCARCKKIYKTRELCRIRDGHTAVAWNTTHLCVSLDDSCFTQNARGDMCLVDENKMKFVASTLKCPTMPYRAKKSDMLAKTPICMACKQKNYTRNHCRDKQKHRELPWGTAYVLLSAVPILKESIAKEENIENSDVGTKRNSLDDSSPLAISEINEGHTSKRRRTEAGDSGQVDDTSDSIWEIESSRAFLLTITGKSTTLQWLQLEQTISGSSQVPWDCSDQGASTQIQPIYHQPVQDPGMQYGPQKEWNDYYCSPRPYTFDHPPPNWQPTPPGLPPQEGHHQYPYDYRKSQENRSQPSHDPHSNHKSTSSSVFYPVPESRHESDEWCDNGYCSTNQPTHFTPYSSESVTTQHSDPNNYNVSPYHMRGRPFDAGAVSHYDTDPHHQNRRHGTSPDHYSHNRNNPHYIYDESPATDNRSEVYLHPVTPSSSCYPESVSSNSPYSGRAGHYESTLCNGSYHKPITGSYEEAASRGTIQ